MTSSTPRAVGVTAGRLAVGLASFYLLFAIIGRFVEGMGAVRCGCADDCWCKRPALSVFRWVFPYRHRVNHSQKLISVSDDCPAGGAILKVADMERTITWYTSAGFTVRGRVDSATMNWCEVTRGQTVIQFLAGETPWAGEPCLTGCLYVNVADIETAFAALGKPVVSEWGIEDRPWGPREVVLTDPDGYFITLTQTPGPTVE